MELKNIIVTEHALERFKERCSRKQKSRLIKNKDDEVIKKSIVIELNKGEPKRVKCLSAQTMRFYTRYGGQIFIRHLSLIYCLKPDGDNLILTTILNWEKSAKFFI